MKIAIVYLSPTFSIDMKNAVMKVIRFQSFASAYKNSIKIFTLHTDAPCLDMDLDMLPRHLPRKNFFAAVSERVKEFAPDIIEAHVHQKCAVFLARQLHPIPTTLTFHNSPRKSDISRRILRPLDFFHLKRVIGVSQYARDSYRRLYPEHKKRIIAIPNAMPAKDYLTDPEAPVKEKIILWVGMPTPKKGLAEFAEALTQTLPHLEGWKGVIISYTAERFFNEVKARFADSLGEQCIWLDALPHHEVIAWMKKAAIFVMPSKHREGFSMAALEAHLAGAAIISSGVSSLVETSGLEGAYYLRQISAQSIAHAIQYLAHNSAERRALAKRGQNYVRQHHRIEDRAGELDQLRRQIVMGKTPAK